MPPPLRPPRRLQPRPSSSPPPPHFFSFSFFACFVARFAPRFCECALPARAADARRDRKPRSQADLPVLLPLFFVLFARSRALCADRVCVASLRFSFCPSVRRAVARPADAVVAVCPRVRANALLPLLVRVLFLFFSLRVALPRAAL